MPSRSGSAASTDSLAAILRSRAARNEVTHRINRLERPRSRFGVFQQHSLVGAVVLLLTLVPYSSSSPLVNVALPAPGEPSNAMESQLTVNIPFGHYRTFDVSVGTEPPTSHLATEPSFVFHLIEAWVEPTELYSDSSIYRSRFPGVALEWGASGTAAGSSLSKQGTSNRSSNFCSWIAQFASRSGDSLVADRGKLDTAAAPVTSLGIIPLAHGLLRVSIFPSWNFPWVGSKPSHFSKYSVENSSHRFLVRFRASAVDQLPNLEHENARPMPFSAPAPPGGPSSAALGGVGAAAYNKRPPLRQAAEQPFYGFSGETAELGAGGATAEVSGREPQLPGSFPAIAVPALAHASEVAVVEELIPAEAVHVHAVSEDFGAEKSTGALHLTPVVPAAHLPPPQTREAPSTAYLQPPSGLLAPLSCAAIGESPGIPLQLPRMPFHAGPPFVTEALPNETDRNPMVSTRREQLYLFPLDQTPEDEILGSESHSPAAAANSGTPQGKVGVTGASDFSSSAPKIWPPAFSVGVARDHGGSQNKPELLMIEASPFRGLIWELLLPSVETVAAALADVGRAGVNGGGPELWGSHASKAAEAAPALPRRMRGLRVDFLFTPLTLPAPVDCAALVPPPLVRIGSKSNLQPWSDGVALPLRNPGPNMFSATSSSKAELLTSATNLADAATSRPYDSGAAFVFEALPAVTTQLSDTGTPTLGISSDLRFSAEIPLTGGAGRSNYYRSVEPIYLILFALGGDREPACRNLISKYSVRTSITPVLGPTPPVVDPPSGNQTPQAHLPKANVNWEPDRIKNHTIGPPALAPPSSFARGLIAIYKAACLAVLVFFSTGVLLVGAGLTLLMIDSGRFIKILQLAPFGDWCGFFYRFAFWLSCCREHNPEQQSQVEPLFDPTPSSTPEHDNFVRHGGYAASNSTGQEPVHPVAESLYSAYRKLEVRNETSRGSRFGDCFEKGSNFPYESISNDLSDAATSTHVPLNYERDHQAALRRSLLGLVSVTDSEDPTNSFESAAVAAAAAPWVYSQRPATESSAVAPLPLAAEELELGPVPPPSRQEPLLKKGLDTTADPGGVQNASLEFNPRNSWGPDDYSVFGEQSNVATLSIERGGCGQRPLSAAEWTLGALPSHGTAHFSQETRPLSLETAIEAKHPEPATPVEEP